MIRRVMQPIERCVASPEYLYVVPSIVVVILVEVALFRWYKNGYIKVVRWERRKKVAFFSAATLVFGLVLPSFVFFPLAALIAGAFSLSGELFVAFWFAPLLLINALLFRIKV